MQLGGGCRCKGAMAAGGQGWLLGVMRCGELIKRQIERLIGILDASEGRVVGEIPIGGTPEDGILVGVEEAQGVEQKGGEAPAFLGGMGVVIPAAADIAILAAQKYEIVSVPYLTLIDVARALERRGDFAALNGRGEILQEKRLLLLERFNVSVLVAGKRRNPAAHEHSGRRFLFGTTEVRHDVKVGADAAQAFVESLDGLRGDEGVATFVGQDGT